MLFPAVAPLVSEGPSRYTAWETRKRQDGTQMRNLNSDRGQGIAEFVLIIALLALLAIGALALFGPIFSTLVSMLLSGI